MSVIHSLLPKELLPILLGEEELHNAKDPEKIVQAITVLVVNILLRAIEAYKKGNYSALDANPGDSGCQNRALELRRLSKVDLHEEIQALEKEVMKVKAQMAKRINSVKEKQLVHPLTFFKENVVPLQYSSDLEYIAHCYLSKVLRTPYEVLPNGVVMTQSELSKLSLLSPKIDTYIDRRPRSKILQQNQTLLSERSVVAVQRVAMTLTLEESEKKRLVTMLSLEHSHLYSVEPLVYAPKTYGCLYFEMKTVLLHLREEKGTVCVKSIVPKGKESFTLMLQPKEAGKEFVVLSDQERGALSSKEGMILFELVALASKEKLIECFTDVGFSNCMLMASAAVSPYEPKSTLASIKLEAAREEVQAEKERGEKLELQKVFELDHLYYTQVSEVAK